MRLDKEIKNRFGFEFGSRIIETISGLLLVIVLTRLLGPDDYGLLYLAVSIIGVAGVFGKFGIPKSAARYVADYKESNPDQLRHILRYSFALTITASFVVCTLLLIFNEGIAIIIGEERLIPFLLIGVIYIIFSTFYRFSRTILQGFEAIEKCAIIKAIYYILRPVLAIGFILLGYGAVGAFVGFTIASTIVGVAGIFILYFQYYPRYEAVNIEPKLRRRITEYSLPVGIATFSKTLDRRIDILLVGFFLSPVSVAYYTLSKQVITAIETPISALSFTVAPTYESQRASGNPDVAAEIYEKAISMSLLFYIPAAVGLIIIAEPTIRLIFGGSYMGAVPVLQVFSIYAVFLAVNKTTSRGLDFLGRAKHRAVAQGITSVLNVALNIILLPIVGVVGAAVATVITYSIYTFVNVHIFRLEIAIDVVDIVNKLIKILFVTLVMAFIVYHLSKFIDELTHLFVVILSGVIVWGGLSIIIGLIDIDEAVRPFL